MRSLAAEIGRMAAWAGGGEPWHRRLVEAGPLAEPLSANGLSVVYQTV